MRVLWFTNIELPAVCRRLSSPVSQAGGWMEGLRAALVSEMSLELGVAGQGSRAFDPFDDEGVRYFHLPTVPRRSGLGGHIERWNHDPDDLPKLAEALGLIDSFKPNLVHVHGSEGPFGLLARVAPVPVLVSLQGITHACTRLYFAGIPKGDVVRDFVSAGLRRRGGLSPGLLKMRVSARRELVILRSCDSFAGRTEWDKGIVSRLNPEAAYYRQEEVLRPEFYLAQWRVNRRGPFIIYCTGGPDPYKGLIVLLRAVALLRRAVHGEVELRISGRVQGTPMWPIVQRAIERLALSGSVVWLGQLSAAGVASELERASVYVHPSLIDNSPNALTEAMIVGLPCVASAAGGIPSMIDDGHDGLLCQPNRPADFAAALTAIAGDGALALRLGENARARAVVRNDPRLIARGTTSMYSDIISRHEHL